jgi:hypothetical protein
MSLHEAEDVENATLRYSLIKLLLHSKGNATASEQRQRYGITAKATLRHHSKGNTTASEQRQRYGIRAKATLRHPSKGNATASQQR